jgi:hypothetical protein
MEDKDISAAIKKHRSKFPVVTEESEHALQLNPTNAKNLTKYTGLTEYQILHLGEKDSNAEQTSTYMKDLAFGRIAGLQEWNKLDKGMEITRWHNLVENKGNIAFWEGIYEQIVSAIP